MLFLLLKNAKDLIYSPVILFDTGTGHTYSYKENSIKYFEDKRCGIQETLISDVRHNYHFHKLNQIT